MLRLCVRSTLARAHTHTRTKRAVRAKLEPAARLNSILSGARARARWLLYCADQLPKRKSSNIGSNEISPRERQGHGDARDDNDDCSRATSLVDLRARARELTKNTRNALLTHKQFAKISRIEVRAHTHTIACHIVPRCTTCQQNKKKKKKKRKKFVCVCVMRHVDQRAKSNGGSSSSNAAADIACALMCDDDICVLARVQLLASELAAGSTHFSASDSSCFWPTQRGRRRALTNKRASLLRARRTGAPRVHHFTRARARARAVHATRPSEPPRLRLFECCCCCWHRVCTLALAMQMRVYIRASVEIIWPDARARPNGRQTLAILRGRGGRCCCCRSQLAASLAAAALRRRRRRGGRPLTCAR